MLVVLDAWAVMALLQSEPAAPRVHEVLETHDAHMSSVNLGEAYYAILRKRGRRFAVERIEGLRKVIRVHDPDWQLVLAAAEIKARGGVSYPDAFCVATAQRHDAPLYTGDDEIIRLDDAGVEIVDLRTAP
jgi:PIN domain nuclease of toxin-antitoxin system